MLVDAVQNRARQGKLLKSVKGTMSRKKWKIYIDNDLNELWEEKEMGSLSFGTSEADTLIRLYEFGEKYPGFLLMAGMTFERFEEHEEWIKTGIKDKSKKWSQEAVDEVTK